MPSQSLFKGFKGLGMIGFEVFTIDREGEPLYVNNSHSVMMLVIGSLMGRPDHGRDSTRVENWALV